MKQFFVPGSWQNAAAPLKFKKTEGTLGGTTQAKRKKQKQKTKKQKKTTNTSTSKNVGVGRGVLAPAAEKKDGTRNVKSGRVQKQNKTKKQKSQKLQMTPALAKAVESEIVSVSVAPTTGVSALEAKLKEQLMGGRFRYINEQLYTMDSRDAQQLFREDGDAFGAYHAGYRHQVEKWPINPLDRIIKMIKRLPKSLEIVDFGCGEGKLSLAVPHKVYSIDLVSARDDIIACDMANTPLKAETLDVAVYCLSLMGINLKEYLLEANRVLKIGGLLYVAEIQSRFTDTRQFIKNLGTCGFELVKQDAGVKLFYFFQFKKVQNVPKIVLVPDFELKPCLYRKR